MAALLGHRLDKDTSGPFVVAEDQDAWNQLRLTSSTHRWYKRYQALIHGELPKEKWFGRLEYPLAHQKMCTKVDERLGDVAITDYSADHLLEDRHGN